MPLTLTDGATPNWTVRKIGVIGPGIVGMPMAALLAQSFLDDADPATVTVLQRPSPTSGWKVEAINAGRSPIGGVEPALDRIVATTAARGILRATHDPRELSDADVVLVCVQTDKRGDEPDYGPLFEALTGLADALRHRPAGNIPLVVFESTLAPSSMMTVIREHFRRFGLEDGRDVLLGNSPNRVMPGRLVERVASSDKIVAGLRPITVDLIRTLYRRIVTGGTLHGTNSLTAEIVKTLENAYRDVRIAYSAEVVRHCDAEDFDFYALRDAVNDQLALTDSASTDPNAVPSGGLLIPTVGVGGHCLPKDGVLLWWRRLEQHGDRSRSLILEARRINDEAPAETLRLAERHLGPLDGEHVALLGTAYRFNSEDTRNSPTLALARLLRDRGCRVVLHDPYVPPTDQNLIRFGFQDAFTRDLKSALAAARYAIVCTAHRDYIGLPGELSRLAPQLVGLVDACNLFARDEFETVRYCGIGRGRRRPPAALVDSVAAGFRAVERGVANELAELTEFLNEQYAPDEFNRAGLDEVRALAATCVTGCAVPEPGPVRMPTSHGFDSRLVRVAMSTQTPEPRLTVAG